MDSLRTSLWIVWGTFAAAIAVYFGLVALGVRADHAFLAEEGFLGLVLAVALCCALIAGLSWWIRVQLIERPVARGSIAPGTAQGTQRITVLFLGVWGLGEAIGLAGFLLYYGGIEPGLCLPFLGAAAALHLFHAPFPGRLERPLTSYEMAAGQGRIG